MQPFSLRKLVTNTFFLSAGRWAAQILNIIAVPVMLAYVSPEDYGIFSVFQVVALIGGVVMSLGLSTAFMSQFGNSQNQEDSNNLLGRMITQQVIWGSALLTLALFLSRHLTTWLTSHQSVLLLQLFFLGEYFANFVLIINRWQILTNRHWQLSLGAVSKSVAQFILLLILVIWKRYGLLGLVISELGAKFISLLVVFLPSRGLWKFQFQKPDLSMTLKLGLPAMPDPIFFWLLLFLPLYLMERQGYLILAGAFSLGWRLLSPVELLGNSLASAAADKILDKKTEALNLTEWHRLSIIAILFSALGLLFFSNDILHLLFKSEYAQILPLLPVMATGILFLSFYYFEWVGISGSNKTYGLSLASGGGALVLMIGTLFLRNVEIGLSMTVLFSLGFFTMWMTARRMNSDRKLGYSPYMIAGVLLTALAGSVAVLFPSSWSAMVIKALFLGFVVLFAGVMELFIRYQKKKSIKGSSNTFLGLPNYAEIAKRIRKDSTLLDIGCSEGFFLGDLEITGLKVGLDNDFERLAAGKKERSHVNFVCASATQLPFRPETFSTVVMIGVLPYLPDRSLALTEVHRVLKEEGQMELSSASEHWYYRYLNVYNWKHRFSFYSPDEVTEILKEAGFTVNLIYERGMFFAPLLGNVFLVPNFIDRWRGDTGSVLGPTARMAREMTNPLIQWEYNHHIGTGYQIFVSGVRK